MNRASLTRLLALVVAVVAVVGVEATGAHAATDANPPVRRVLVLSMPAVSYRDLQLDELPNLRRLLEQSALADLSARGVHRRPTLADGYVTIGAGTRAVGRPGDDGQCLQGAEAYEDGSASEAMARRIGVPAAQVSPAAVVCLDQPRIVNRNDGLLYDAKIGALAEALDHAGVERAVIGNADTAAPPGAAGYQRPVGLALADADGIVPGGDVTQDLIRSDPAAPFGVAAAPDAYMQAFDRAWNGRTVVVVEASDLVRYDAYRSSVAKSARAGLEHQLLRDWDALIGRMLQRVDPARDAVMVVGPSPLGGTARLPMATLRAPGLEPGLLRSAYTRQSGLVSIVDVAPTVLHELGIERPSEMEGRSYEYAGKGGTFKERLDWLIDVDDAARFRDSLVGPVTVFVAVSEIVLMVLALGCFQWFRRGLPVIEFVALALLGVLPAVYLARLLPFHDWGTVAYWGFLLAVALAIAALTWFTTARDGIMTLIAILAVVVGVVAVDVVTGAHLQFNSTLGYSPTVAGRYAGIGNLGYAQLSAGTLLLAGLVAARVRGRRGVWIAIGMLGAAFFIDGAPFFGADVGGVLSMVPAYAFAATLMLGRKVRAKAVLLYGTAAVVLIGLIAAFDASRPEDKQTHLGRLVHSTADDGWSAFATVIERKLDANLSVLFRSSWTAMLPIVLAGVVVLFLIAPGLAIAIRRMPTLRAALYGLIVLAVLGFALNDSGIAVPAMMLSVVSPILIVLASRGERLPPESVGDAEPVRELVRT